MSRIFLVLASLDGLALLGSTVLGAVYKLRGGQTGDQEFTWMAHYGLGLGSAILNLFVHCLIFTYFLGTGRWVKEVALAYSLPDVPYPKLTRELKRKTFPPALFGMLITIATVAAGAGAQLQSWHWTIHASLAVLTLILNMYAFVVEYRSLSLNGVVIEKVLEEVERMRAERGLPSSQEALSGNGG
jgi:hypothetical protein